jgi:hypothetical protein
MEFRRLPQLVALFAVPLLFMGFRAESGGHSPKAAAKSTFNSENSSCKLVGGMVMTNFGAIDASTTMGNATGDLQGAVSGTILSTPQPGSGNTVVFHVQHHWVTDAGDTIFFDPAVATTIPVSQTVFAIVTYPVHIKGGTGKFAGATGDLSNIGEVDISSGTVFRYTGQVCFAEGHEER